MTGAASLQGLALALGPDAETSPASNPLKLAHNSLNEAVAAWLDWQILAGVSDCLRDPDVLEVEAESEAQSGTPLAQPVAPPPAKRHVAISAVAAVQEARELAARAQDLDELGRLLAGFTGCALSSTASHLCYAIGTPRARLMILGDAPDTADDLEGRPFSGEAGLLLERMLAAIGLSPERVWATNVVFWRPPGNRPASAAELAICRPFVERQIELLSPELILTLGGPATRALLSIEGVESRLRGRDYRYVDEAAQLAVPARATFHPTTLLREPLKKRLAWRDLQEVARMLDDRQETMQKTSSRQARPLPRPLHDTEPEGGTALY